MSLTALDTTFSNPCTIINELIKFVEVPEQRAVATALKDRRSILNTLDQLETKSKISKMEFNRHVQYKNYMAEK